MDNLVQDLARAIQDWIDEDGNVLSETVEVTDDLSTCKANYMVMAGDDARPWLRPGSDTPLAFVSFEGSLANDLTSWRPLDNSFAQAMDRFFEGRSCFWELCNSYSFSVWGA